MNTNNLNHVACFCRVGDNLNGDWVLEFCHNFEDAVAAAGWIDIQVEEWIISDPDILTYRTGSNGKISQYISRKQRLEYKYVQCNVYAAIDFCDRVDSNVKITEPTPLWTVVIYRRGVPEFDPEVDQTYAATEAEAKIKTLSRLGAGWDVYKAEKVEWKGG